MSQAKRDQSAFRRSTLMGCAVARPKPEGIQLRMAPERAGLRVLGSWENRPVPSGDPYNGIGARAVSGRGLAK
jgi:hypothetical protein